MLRQEINRHFLKSGGDPHEEVGNGREEEELSAGIQGCFGDAGEGTGVQNNRGSGDYLTTSEYTVFSEANVSAVK